MYDKTIRLNHHEDVMILNKETGEIKESPKRANNIPQGKEVFEPEGIFSKRYDAIEEYLDKILTPLEFRVVSKMCRMALPNTNSLQPLSDDTNINVLAEEFNISRNTVPKLLKKLFELGVYAKFELVKEDIGYTKYWILNPYVSFKGKLINSDIKELFIGTTIHKQYLKYNKEKKIS